MQVASVSCRPKRIRRSERRRNTTVQSEHLTGMAGSGGPHWSRSSQLSLGPGRVTGNEQGPASVARFPCSSQARGRLEHGQDWQLEHGQDWQIQQRPRQLRRCWQSCERRFSGERAHPSGEVIQMGSRTGRLCTTYFLKPEPLSGASTVTVACSP